MRVRVRVRGRVRVGVRVRVRVRARVRVRGDVLGLLGEDLFRTLSLTLTLSYPQAAPPP